MLLFWIGYVAILFCAGFLKSSVPAPGRELFWGTVGAVGTLLLTLLFLRMERRRADDVGLRVTPSSVPRFVAGLFIGGAIYAIYLLIVTMAGGARLSASHASPAVAITSVCTYLALSCMEELGFRGYPLRTLVARMGLWKAQALVAVAFALCHLAFGWPWLAVLLGVIPGAILFGLAAIASRGLALPIGLHAAWNIASWSVGEKGAPGVWQLAGGNGTVSTAGFLAVFLLAAAAFWYRARASSLIVATPARSAGRG